MKIHWILVLFSPNIFSSLESFEVLEELDMGSEHFPIKVVFNLVTNRTESCFGSIKRKLIGICLRSNC